MNHIFRTIWSASRQCWIAVPEVGVLRRGGGRSPRRRLHAQGSALALALCALLPSVTHAQDADRNWDANNTAVGTGGTGTWNTTSATWSPNADGVSGPYGAWNNALLDDAIFGGTGGTVTLGVPITVNDLIFNTNGYILNGSTLTLGGVTPTITTNAGVSATINSIIAGTAGLTKAGTGTLALNGVNTFSGAINVNAGGLTVNGDASLGNASNGIFLANGAVLTSNAALNASRVVTLVSGTSFIRGAGTGAAHYTGAGSLNLGSGIALTDNSNDYTGQTALGANGSFSFSSIANVGGGASALGAPTTVANGLIVLNPADAGATAVYTGGAVSSDRGWQILSRFFGNSGITNAGTGTLTLTGNILGQYQNGAFAQRGTIFTAQSADLVLSGVISGSQPVLTLTGGGTSRTITLGGANTYTTSSSTSISNVTVKAGILANTGVASSFGTSGAIGVTNGVLSYTGAGASSNRAWGLNNGTLANDGTGALALSGTLGLTNTGTLGGSYAGSDNLFTGVISGTGSLAMGGAGTWVISGANTYTGSTIVNSGTLRAGSTTAFGVTSGAVVNGGTLDLNDFNLTLPSLAGTGGTIDLGTGTLTLDAPAPTSTSYAGNITGTGGLTKAGGSTQTLTGTNTYTGATTVNGGTLRLDFSAAGGPTSDILSSASTLNMGGGTLNAVGAAGEANTQTFNGLNVLAGNNNITATSGTGGSMIINFGAINRTGGLINFGLPASGNLTTTNLTLGGWATVNGTDYAKVDAGNIVAFTAADYTNKDDASTWLDNEIISDAGGTANTAFFSTVSGSKQIGGLRYTAAANSTVTVAAGQRLGVDGTIIVAPSVGAFNQTITGGQITGTLGGGVLGIQQNGTGNFTIASQIVDNGGSIGFTKAGTGLASLSNATSNYTGATIVSQGILAVNSIANGGAASSIGASSAASSNLFLEGSTLRYTGATTSSDRGFTIAKSGAILGSGIEVTSAAANLTFSGLVTSTDGANFTKSGAGTLTLANAGNDYTGVTTVNGGTLGISTLANGGLVSGIGASSNASGNLVVNGGTLSYSGGSTSTDRGFTVGILGAGGASGGIGVSNAASTLTMSGTVVGDDGLRKEGAGTLVLSGTNTYSGGTTVNAGTLRAGSTTAFGNTANNLNVAAGATADINGFNTSIGVLLGSGNVTLGAATLTSTGNTGTFSGVISGSGGFTRGGAFAVLQTMTGCNNTYTGATNLNNGQISVNCLANGGLASGIGASTSASSSLVFNTGILHYTGGSVSIDRGFTAQSGPAAINVSNAATTLGFSGAVVGPSQVRKDGPGTLVLSGINTYTGGTFVTGGILRAGSATAFGSGQFDINNTAGATLDLNGFNSTFAWLAGGGTTGGNINLGAGTLTISSGNGTAASGVVYAGAISGTGNLVKNGAQYQRLSGCTSTYTGTTTINGGALSVDCLTNGGSNSAIGASSSAASNLVIGGGATLAYTGAATSSDRLFTLGAGGGVLDASGTGALNLTNTGAIALSGTNTARTFTLTGTNTGNNVFAAQLTNNGTGATSLTKTGAGTWVLTNNNSNYTGVTTISGGVLGVSQLANGGVASGIGAASSAASNLVIGSGSTLRYTGAGDTTDRLFTLGTGVAFIESSGTGAINFSNTGAVTLSGTNTPRTIALGGTNTGNNTLGGAIGNNGTGATTLAKNDSGTWVLTGNNTFTGNTVINAGNLIIGNGGTTGNAGAGNVIIDSATSTLSLNRSDTFTFSGVLSGPGTLAQIGTGTSVLTGASNSVGATTISAGTLQVDGTLTTPTLGMTGTSTLVVNGTVQAPGALPVSLSGDAGAQTIIVNSGVTLRANLGPGAGNDTINLAGTLDTGGATLDLGDGDDTMILRDGASLLGAGVDGGANNDALQVQNTAALTIDGAFVTNFETLLKTNAGVLTLTGDHSYSAGTTIAAGTLQIGAGGATGSIAGNIANSGVLVFNRSGALTYSGVVSGSGPLNQIGPGITTLTGANSYSGPTNVNAGTLRINGDQSAATGLTTVFSGATLGGTGTIGGSVLVLDGGTLSPGNTPGTTTIAGNLTLNNASVLDFEFGQANVPGGPLNDLINVGGNLTLDGTINVTESAGGSFGAGVYRVFNYGGTFTDNGLALGSMPAGSTVSVQTAVAGQVNLVNTAGQTMFFWDGPVGPKNDSVIQGGTGTWRLGGGANDWTDSGGVANSDFQQDSFAVFSGAPGTVTVDDVGGPVGVSGMQFAVNGYTVTGDGLALAAAQTPIRVGDGTPAGAAMAATVGSVLAGAGQLVKTDLGTLVLSGVNTYTGGTLIDDGTLRISSNANLGDLAGGLTFDGGTLQNTAAFTSARAVTLTGAGTFQTDANLTLTGIVSGAGALTKTGAGSLILSNTNTYSGATTVNAGTLRAGAAAGGQAFGNLSAVTLANVAGATLDLNGFSQTIGSLAGSGTTGGNVTLGTGTLTTGGNNTSTSYAGVISGTGGLTKAGTGTQTLSGTSTYTGATTVNAGVLRAGAAAGGQAFGVNSAVTLANVAGATLDLNGFNQTIGSLAAGGTTGGNVTLGSATLTTGGNNASTSYAGVIGGTGGLTKIGTGIQTLTGTNTYTGATTINGGTLRATAAAGGQAFGNLSAVTLANVAGATLELVVPAGLQTIGSLAGGGASGGNVILAGGTVLAAGGDNTSTTFAGVISGGGALFKNGSGVMTLTGTNTHTQSRVYAGTLRAGATAGGQSFGLNARVELFGTATLDLNGFNQTVSALVGIGTPLASVTLGSATLTTGANNSSSGFFSGVISGTGGVTKIGTGAQVLLGINTYTGATTVNAGTLRAQGSTSGGQAFGNLSAVTIANVAGATLHLSNSSQTIGSLAGGGATGGAVSLTGSVLTTGGNNTSTSFAGVISGTGGLTKTGTGTQTLSGTSTYTGATTVNAGVLQAGAAAGGQAFGNLSAVTLADVAGATLDLNGFNQTVGSLAGGGTTGGNVTLGAGTLTTGGNNTSTSYAGVISGTGGLTKTGTGTQTLTGSNSYTGATSVAAGTLLVNGDQSAATGLTSVLSGATLGGTGTVGGDVAVADSATLAPGSNGVGTLTINGNLSLAGTSLLGYEFGQAGTAGGPLNDLTSVSGNLVLDGTIDVTVSPGGSFTAGLYRVLNYGGTLTDNGLDLGTMPAGADVFVQTSIANQVNLVNTAGLTLNFWDGALGPKNNGAIDGGDGIWQDSSGNDNWTEATGALNAPFTDISFAIFSATPGTVTVDNGVDPVIAAGMQFAVDGYTITGDPLTLDGGAQSIVRVGDGTLAGAGYTATINTELTGATQLVKTDLGTLVLSGVNTYTGGTLIDDGTLRISADANLGDAAGALAFDGGTLHTIADIASNRSVDLIGPGTLLTDTATTLTLGGVVSGAGALTKDGAGATVVTGANSYTGGTTITAGTLQLGDGGTTGSIVGDVVNNATLAFNRSDTVTFAGLISGSGGVNKDGAGTTILTSNNSYTGLTGVTSGTLLINGNQSAATGDTTVSVGATLGGTGIIGGDVFLADGATLAPGDASGPGTLTINSSLALAGTSRLDYDFGQSNVVGGPLNDLTEVAGDLVLDGTIDVTVSPGGSFDVGVYRVISYGGALTDNGLALGTLPSGASVAVQTSVASQVNLVNTAGLTLNFWDGAAGPKNDNAVNGSDGIWQNSTGNNNWTDISGAVNAPFSDAAFAIFSAASGTVTVDNSLGAVTALGMQFASNGYVVTGGDLMLVGPQSVVRVGDGTAAGLGFTATIASALAGTTQLVKTDLGTLVLSGTNTYTGGTLIDAGTLSVSSDANLGNAAGGLSFDGGTLNSTASLTSSRGVDLIGAATLLTDAGTTLTLGGAISGAGTLTKDGAGTLVLTGANSYAGGTAIAAGTLFVNGNQSAATGLTSIDAGATLGGTGTIGGDVTLADGATLASGAGGVGTLTINGALGLGSGTVLDYQFGQANAAGGGLNDLVIVGGGLVLDGTINVSVPAGGSFGGGVYRVFNYDGALTNNGLALGALPTGSDVSVQTVIAGQVNLVNTAGLTLNFWDGAAGPKNNSAIDGGNGIWRAGGGNNNWTELTGRVNADYAQNSFAIFAGAPGTVTVDDVGGVVRASGMQFAMDGYTIIGDALTLTGPRATVRVGDGTTAGAGYTATIAAELTGATTLVKTDAGTLVLTGTNTYTDGTAIDGGTLRITSDANLGAAVGSLSFNGGTLNTTSSFNSGRAVNLIGMGTLLTDAGTTLTLTGATSGTGGLTKSGAGTLVLGGAGSHTGGANVAAGTLLVNGNYAGATGVTSVVTGATLGGTGTIGGDVTLADGAILTPGAGAPGTLTVNGDLSLAAATRLAYEFGQANTAGGALNDLVNVGGDLVLDGTIDVAVSASGGFDVGVYRVFNYGGALTNNGLALGALPTGSDVSVQTSIAGQVNLVNTAGLTLNFWDGAAGPKNNGIINGGNGTWQNNTGNDNWTDASGAVNAAYSDGAFAIFGGTGGTVTVDNGLGAVTASGMQFAANGYTISGGEIALTEPQSIIRVGDGSAAGSGFTATINSAIAGATRLVKTDAGTLVLGGTNSYAGGTLISGGTLQITADANLGAAAGDVTLDGGTLATSANVTSARDIVVAGAGAISTASGTTFTFNGLLSGSGALTKAGAGTLLLTGDNSAFAGSTQVEGTLTVNGSLCGDVNVRAGGRLQGTGTVCTTINAGTVAPGNSIGTLTVQGSYTGTGGTLEIEAELAGDASPTDRLVVTEGTAGSTEVVVINTGGLGAQTNEGIKIVDVTGGASNGAFTLRGDYNFEGSPAVIAGAYGYRLFMGGASTPADGDWYLRSALLDGLGEPEGPLYQPGVPLYESYAQTLQTLNGLPTLQERIGNRQWSGFTNSGVGMWGRIEGGRHRPEAAVSTSGTDLNTNSRALQVGFDATVMEADAGVLIGGINGRYGTAEARVRSRFGDGKIDADGFGIGATLTWYGAGGFYADAQAQLSWYDSHLDSDVLGSLVRGNDGKGEAFSLEVGQRLPMGESLSITPQAQIVYSNVRFNTFVDPAGAMVSAEDGDSLRGRLGLSLDHQKSWQQQGGGTARTHLYAIANLDYEMLDGTRADVSGTPMLRRDDRLWGELGIGGSYSWADGRFTLFSEISADTALSNFGDSNSLKANAGFRMRF